MGVMKKLYSSQRRPKPTTNKLLNLPFEISLQSLSEADKFQRQQNKDRLDQFNQDVKDWAQRVTKMLKSNVRSMVKRDHVLSKSIRPNFYYDRQYETEISRIGFSFAREGIWIHKGAGKGQGGFLGSKWYNLRGELKSTSETSKGKMGNGNRQPIEWFDPIIEQMLPELADIVAEYSGSLQIDATSIYID